jgi:hypothetical protein
MGLFSRFFVGCGHEPSIQGLPPFAAGKFPFGNLLLTLIGVWLGA